MTLKIVARTQAASLKRVSLLNFEPKVSKFPVLEAAASSTFATIRKSFYIFYLIIIYLILRILLLPQRIRHIMLEWHVVRILL